MIDLYFSLSQTYSRFRFDNPHAQWDVDLYQNHHSFVWEYGASLVDLLDPRPGERILDVGCGSGELAQTISEKGADVVGIDADPQMIQKAAAGFPNITFRCTDASKLEEEASSSLGRPFDAIFSNAALHWVTDAEASARPCATSCTRQRVQQ